LESFYECYPIQGFVQEQSLQEGSACNKEPANLRNNTLFHRVMLPFVTHTSMEVDQFLLGLVKDNHKAIWDNCRGDKIDADSCMEAGE
jgi:hypothetical protein